MSAAPPRIVRAASYELGVAARVEVGWLPLAVLAADPGPWRDLARRAIEPNVFLEPAFAAPAAAHLSTGEVNAVVAWRGGQLVGLMPGRVEGIASGRPVPTFVAWTHPYAPFSTPLVDSDARAESIAAMLRLLPSLPGAPRAALFPFLHEQGPVARALASRSEGRPSRLGEHRRAALMPGVASEKEGLSPGRTKELRRLRRRLDEEGKLSRETISDALAMRAAVAEYLELEAAGWKGKRGTAAQLDAEAAAFFREALPGLAAQGKARLDFLRLDGKAIAAAVTLFSGDRAWFWKIAYDEAHARFSPGVQLTLDLTETLAGDGRIKLVDSCATPDHPMIDTLWNGRIAIADWLVPLAGRTSFIAAVVAERARRAAIAPLKLLRDRLRR